VLTSHYHPQTWQLLVTPAAAGAWNMALDEVILEAVEQNRAPATLRLYAWDPPCLSIGYAQPSKDIDITRLEAMGWDWVRRLTGGRAILHTDELTYSIIAPQSDPRVSGGVLESYRRLSAALLKALHSLNIPAESQPNHQVDRNLGNAAVCFEVPSNYEIVVGGKKLIGSAQARRKSAVLQHGTFPLWGDLTRITQVLAFSDDQDRNAAATRLLSHATTAESVLGGKLNMDRVVQAFISSFQSELNIQLFSGSLSDKEIMRANILVKEKYQHSSWLNRI
jgi:lipoyl(octanoyl) transferase